MIEKTTSPAELLGRKPEMVLDPAGFEGYLMKLRNGGIYSGEGDSLAHGGGLRRDNHYLPACYQKGFADSSGMVWVKFANRGNTVHWHPSRVGKQRGLYVRCTGTVEDDGFEDFFSKQVENPFSKFSQRVKREQNHLSSATGEELGALERFVASQIVRTRANKQSMEEQVGRPLSSNEFLTEMSKQWKAILNSWRSELPDFEFYTSLPYVQERFITGDDPVLPVVEDDPVVSVVESGNPVWVPSDEPQRRIASPQAILNLRSSFRVALSPYICVFLRAHGGGEAYLPPQTMEASEVRRFNDLIRQQCGLFTLAKDEVSLM